MLNRLSLVKAWLLVIVLAKALSINSPAFAQIIQTNPQMQDSFQERIREQQEDQDQQTQEQMKETWLRLNLQEPQLQQQQRILQQEFTVLQYLVC